MDATRKRVERFLRQHFHGSLQGQSCEHVTLKHVTPHTKRGPGSEIFTWERPGASTDDVLSILAAEIFSTAESDATGWDGIQTYCLHAYYDGSKTSKGRCSLRVEGVYDEEFEESSEPPSLEGALKQQMRHNEALLRAVVQGNQTTATMQARIIDRLSGQVEYMERQRIETFQIYEKLLSEQADRDLAFQEASQRSEHRDRVLKGMETLIPVVANRMSGRKLLPASDPTADMIRNLKESILGDEEKLSKLKDVLDKNDWITLMELAGSIEENH